MTPQYHATGTTLRDSFVYLTDTGTFVTGLAQADFTIKLSKSGTGNQSTAGITLSQVDATNNPGEYAVVAASSAFPALDGVYTLVVTRTADPKFTFEQVWIVNQTGTPAATPTSFTATSGDGRITDGSSPIEAATIYVSLGSTFITSTETDAAGVWGPVYLPGDGTYTVRAQLDGYSQGTGTITVSGVTVTGPGADIVLSVASVSNPLSGSQLWAYARRMSVDITGTKADTIIKSAVHDALDMVSSERTWPWLLRRAYLTLRQPYTTGSLTVTNGDATVTLATGTWPSWAASGRLFFNSQIIDVASRTNGTTIELATEWGGETASGVGYILFQNEYELPDDLWAFHAALPGERWLWGSDPVSPLELFQAENAFIYGDQFPSIHTVHAGALAVWPYPSSANSLAYTYWARPARLTFDADIADWDPVHLEVLHRAIDYHIARQATCVAGTAEQCMGAYKEALARAEPMDKSPSYEAPIGVDVPRRDRIQWWRRS